MPKPNDIIGPYTLIRRLGRGSFGIVWLAEKRSQIVTTQVALKIAYDDEIDLELIKEEARIWLQAGGHPNIVRFIDADVYDSRPVIVSEYVRNGSLTDWVARHEGKAPSVERALAIIDGVLAGLEHLHARNIIHRDLKPDNILLEGEVARLADFGIARLLESTGAHTTRVAGTPKYMAPESFRGKKSEQTDIWSTGIVLYHLLTGRCPFEAEDAASLMYAILDQPVPPLPDDLPDDLKSVVWASLAKDPDSRYQTAGAMRRAVRKLLGEVAAPQRVISSPDDPTLIDLVHSGLESKVLTNNTKVDATDRENEGSGWEFTDRVVLDTKRAEIMSSFANLKGLTLSMRSRALYWNFDKTIRVGCTVSKRYGKGKRTSYWYAYHPRWDSFLGEGKSAYLLLGCMDLNVAFAIPIDVIRQRLDELNLTSRPHGKSYWHLKIIEKKSGFVLQMPKTGNHLLLGEYSFQTNP